MRRKIILLATAILLAASVLLLPGCGESQAAADGDERLRVIATIFPQFDFVRQVAGDRVELSMLLAPGAESHGFEPTARDIVALNNADLFIYVGGHGDAWVEPIIASLERGDELRAVALVDLVETVMTEHHHHDDHAHDHHHSHDHGHDEHHHDHSSHNHDNHSHDDHEHHHDSHGHDHDSHSHHDDHAHGHHHSHDHGHDEHHHHHGHDHEHQHHHEPHLDEHVWTCPRNAVLIVQALADILAELDPDNAEFFRENAAAYIAELQALEQAFTEAASEAARTTVVFGDRFPFRYLMNTLGLTAHAAFDGCSPETHASPATIARLIGIVRDENIPVVFHIELSEQGIANTIAEETGARILELHSTHNMSPADFAAGVTYLDLMRRNVEHLREALS